jgi:NADH dehydrogenase FAD-containing subunit
MATLSRLVLLGAGHAHLRLIHAIPELKRKGISVTVIDPHDRLYYSGMMSAVLGGAVAPVSAEIPVRQMVESAGATFIQDRITHLDPPHRRAVTAGGDRIYWDVASLAVGSIVKPPFPVTDTGTPRVFPVKPVGMVPEIGTWAESFLDRPDMNRPLRVVCIGGGPSAVEITGNLIRRLSHTRGVTPGDGSLSVTVITRGSRLLAAMPDAAAGAAEESLRRRGVILITDSEVRQVSPEGVVTDAAVYPADMVILATGLRPPALHRSGDSEALRGTPSVDGALSVDATLRAAHGSLFGGGDCIALEGHNLQKIGVHAVRQSAILYRNVLYELGLVRNTAGPQRYEPPPAPLLIIDPGDGSGIAVKGSIVRTGRSWLAVKRRIDWAFVRSRGRSIRPTLFGPPPAGPGIP